MGCPIRIPADQPVCAGPRGLSQLAASFFASESLGIPRAPLITSSPGTGTRRTGTPPVSRGAFCCNLCSTFQRTCAPLWGQCEACRKTTAIRNSRKEVFQPHLPVRLPCYDLAPVTGSTLNGSLRSPASGLPDFHGLTGGVYKVRERIHRAMADARLLAIPASRGRVAGPDPN